MTAIDVDEVRTALVPTDVLDSFGIAYEVRGAELRTRMCPICGSRSRSDTVAIHATTGVWIDHAHDHRGDIFDLVAGYAGLDARLEFGRTLTIAARIAGLTDDGSDIELVPFPRSQPRNIRRAHTGRLSTAAIRASWAAHAHNDPRGEAYLRGRGIDPDALRIAGDVVRYTSRGEPAVALRDLDTGDIVGIQRRRIDGGAPKVLSLAGSRVADACLFGHVADLAVATAAVLVEGLADTLVARLAWPMHAIYGAPGAAQMRRIVEAIAPRIAARAGNLLLVVDRDRAGIDGAARAIIAAKHAGLAMAAHGALDRGSTIELVRLGRGADGRAHHDLANAWRAGWRPEAS